MLLNFAVEQIIFDLRDSSKTPVHVVFSKFLNYEELVKIKITVHGNINNFVHLQSDKEVTISFREELSDKVGEKIIEDFKKYVDPVHENEFRTHLYSLIAKVLESLAPIDYYREEKGALADLRDNKYEFALKVG